MKVALVERRRLRVLLVLVGGGDSGWLGLRSKDGSRIAGSRCCRCRSGVIASCSVAISRGEMGEEGPHSKPCFGDDGWSGWVADDVVPASFCRGSRTVATPVCW